MDIGTSANMRQPIDHASLSSYLAWRVPSVQLPISIAQFKYGQSNPTYLITDADKTKFVIRKKPAGQLLSQTAHQVEREYRVLSALQETAIPVPKVYALCLDSSVVGTPFYIMEYLDGRVFADPALPNVPHADRSQMWQCTLQVLAALHSLHPAVIGLQGFGKASDFYSRQLKVLKTVSESQANSIDAAGKSAGKMPHAEEILEFLDSGRRQPADRSCLIHGDFKIDNLVFHADQPHIIGILDWEMSTIGHPLSDLSNLLSPYSFAASPANGAMSRYRNAAFAPGTQWPGLPSRQQCSQIYAQHSGWSAERDLAWGAIFASFRNAVILQGIAARHAQGQASSDQAEEMAEMRGPQAIFCWALIQQYLDEKETPSQRSKL